LFHIRGAWASFFLRSRSFLSNTAEERIEALDAGVPFHRPFGSRQDDGSGSNRENISSTPLHISGVRPVSTPLAQSSRVYFLAVSRRISRITSVERNLKNENLYCL
jgi:hypothetical protein